MPDAIAITKLDHSVHTASYRRPLGPLYQGVSFWELRLSLSQVHWAACVRCKAVRACWEHSLSSDGAAFAQWILRVRLQSQLQDALLRMFVKLAQPRCATIECQCLLAGIRSPFEGGSYELVASRVAAAYRAHSSPAMKLLWIFLGLALVICRYVARRWWQLRLNARGSRRAARGSKAPLPELPQR